MSTGHYSRPDALRLLFNRKPSARVHAFDPEYAQHGGEPASPTSLDRGVANMATNP